MLRIVVYTTVWKVTYSYPSSTIIYSSCFSPVCRKSAFLDAYALEDLYGIFLTLLKKTIVNENQMCV